MIFLCLRSSQGHMIKYGRIFLKVGETRAGYYTGCQKTYNSISIFSENSLFY